MFIGDPSKPFEEQTLEELPSVDEACDSIYANSWSPDGQWLAGSGYHQDRDTCRDLRVFTGKRVLEAASRFRL